MANEADLSGMTVNERLFAMGLMEDFDRARSHWNVEALRRILVAIDLADYDIEQLRD
ncbi:MAG: hypothetical protein P8J20_18375 [Novosphingobium sp.]|nr:hypothetical protein [Novosphingobium sp.]